jgi:hypothetical protein
LRLLYIALPSFLAAQQEEMLNSMLAEEDPTRKLALCLLAASLVSAAASAVCWLCGIDPLGGASLSMHTARAAAVGGAAAVPLVAGKALLWSEGARRQLPFLEDIHKSQVGAAPEARFARWKNAGWLGLLFLLMPGAGKCG